MTEYEALQEQRKIERGIRRWKREEAAMKAAGLDTSEASAKVREWNRKHKDFLEQTGLKADGTRLAVGKSGVLGFKDIEKNFKGDIINERGLFFEELGSLRLPDEKMNKILRDERLLAKEVAEYAIVYDIDGNVLFMQSGEVGKVGFTEAQVKQMKGAIATHNHFRGGSFSPRDIYMLKETGLAEIRACTRDGVYIMTQPDKWDERLSSYEAIKEEHKKLLKPHKDRYVTMVKEGKISKYEANIKYQQRAMDDFVKEFKLDYRFERSE